MLYSEKTKTDLLLELLVENCGNDDVEFFKSVDVSNVEFSKRYYRKRWRIINISHWKSVFISLKNVGIRVAASVLVVLSLGAATVMAVPTLREATKEKIIETVKEWREEDLQVTFSYGEENKEEAEYVPVKTIEKVNKPLTLPEGITEEVYRNDSSKYVSDYYFGDEWITDFKQFVKSENTTLVINTENCALYDVVINGKKITVSVDSNKIDKVIFWEDKDYFYLMNGIDLDIMLDLISRIP